MTLGQYVQNPTGNKKSRAHMVGQAGLAKSMYTEKYNKIILKTAGAFAHRLFRAPDDSRFIIMIKIPSESTPEAMYDVGVEFYTENEVCMKETTLDRYFIRFFSNDPNFTFTYAFTYYRNEMIIPELKDKLSPQSLREPPKTTNPHEELGYCKSLYFAQLFIDMKGLTQKILWHGAPKISKSAVAGDVMSAENKIVQVTRLKKIHAATKKSSVHIGDTEDLNNLKSKAQLVKVMKNSRDASQRVYTGKTRKVQRVGTVKRVKR